jgi:hypothetical protein
MNNLPIEIISRMVYEEKDIIVKSTNQRRTPDVYIDKRIEENWERFKEWSIERGLPTYYSDYARIVDIECDGKITFHTGITDFKERMGILPSTDIHRKFGKKAKKYLPNSFTEATIALLKDETSSTKIIPIELREAACNVTAVGYLLQFMHMRPPVYNTITGFISNEKDGSDPRKGIRRKLSAELNLPEIADKLERNIMLGVFYDPNIDETTPCFKSELNCSWQKVKQGIPEEKRRFFYALKNEKNAITNFLNSPIQDFQILPCTSMNLLFHLYDEWGGKYLESFSY